MNKERNIPIVILHGWGVTMSGQKYSELKELLEKGGYRVYAPDLPGFGTNPLDKAALHFEDYIQFLHTFIEKNIKVKKVVLIGHSFGGRLAIRFTKEYPKLVEKLILTGASGIPRPLPSLKKRVVYGITKIARPLFSIPPLSFFYKLFRKGVYYSIGEMDYYKAGSLTETFKNVYRVSIVPDLEDITIPTLIVWGEHDTFTPLADGVLIQRKIRDSELVVFPHSSHKLPYENAKDFSKEIMKFLS